MRLPRVVTLHRFRLAPGYRWVGAFVCDWWTGRPVVKVGLWWWEVRW